MSSEVVHLARKCGLFEEGPTRDNVEEFARLLREADLRHVSDLEAELAVAKRTVPVIAGNAEHFVIARQTVVKEEGAPPELGYTLLEGSKVFESVPEALTALRDAHLSLGWVVMALSQIIPPMQSISIKEMTDEERATVTEALKGILKVTEDFQRLAEHQNLT